MPIRKLKEHTELLAVRIIASRILLVLFRADAKLVKQFTDGIDHTIDTFEFTDGWSDTDEMRGREYLRMACDWIIRPALEDARKRRR